MYTNITYDELQLPERYVMMEEFKTRIERVIKKKIDQYLQQKKDTKELAKSSHEMGLRINKLYIHHRGSMNLLKKDHCTYMKALPRDRCDCSICLHRRKVKFDSPSSSHKSTDQSLCLERQKMNVEANQCVPSEIHSSIENNKLQLKSQCPIIEFENEFQSRFRTMLEVLKGMKESLQKRKEFDTAMIKIFNEAFYKREIHLKVLGGLHGLFMKQYAISDVYSSILSEHTMHWKRSLAMKKFQVEFTLIYNKMKEDFKKVVESSKEMDEIGAEMEIKFKRFEALMASIKKLHNEFFKGRKLIKSVIIGRKGVDLYQHLRPMKDMTDMELTVFHQMAEIYRNFRKSEMANNKLSKNEQLTLCGKRKCADNPIELSALCLFASDELPNVISTMPNLTDDDIKNELCVAKELLKRWNEATQDIKSKYVVLAAEEKAKYDKEPKACCSGTSVAKKARVVDESEVKEMEQKEAENEEEKKDKVDDK